MVPPRDIFPARLVFRAGYRRPKVAHANEADTTSWVGGMVSVLPFFAFIICRWVFCINTDKACSVWANEFESKYCSHFRILGDSCSADCIFYYSILRRHHPPFEKALDLMRPLAQLTVPPILLFFSLPRVWPLGLGWSTHPNLLCLRSTAEYTPESLREMLGKAVRQISSSGRFRACA